jgi:glycosyltransferase involved in cell wall biosynthesis
MLVRDDGSSDATLSILREMAAEEERLMILQDGCTRCGPTRNFGRLLQSAWELEAEYVFLADQDDVWLSSKISRQMDAMGSAEAAAASGTPILVYSDLTVVDVRLQTMHASFFRRARFHLDDRQPLKTLLAHNFIPGCAMLINRPLLELVLPLPSVAPMHDWWIALCAATAGQLAFLPEATLLYRQHGGNAVGAPGFWAAFNPLRTSWKKRWERGLLNFLRHVKQTKALQRRLQERLPACCRETLRLLTDYCRLFDTPAGALHRIRGMHQIGVPQTDFVRRLVFYARILTVRR